MKNEVTGLLTLWCEHLLSVQAPDGGFKCEACGFEHGRADNAIFPFLCMYSLTRDKKWLDGTEKLLDFREKLTDSDGSVCNDFESRWNGITAFSAIGMYKALLHFESIIPVKTAERIEKCFISSAEWVHNNIKPGFRANINYYCASAAVNAMYSARYNNREFAESARSLMKYCLDLFTENGILRGEGQPHNCLTKAGCVPADIGYIVEESIPCLTDAAVSLNDETALKKLADYSAKLLEFMLPDGGWDNSFGSRNNKWTYYGSRTASGCVGAFVTLGKYRPELITAAKANLKLMKKCTGGGALYGGCEYPEHGQKPCIHHTFSHTLSVADALVSSAHNGICTALPFNTEKDCFRYYPELNILKIHCGDWLATVSGYDFSTYTWEKGAAHTSGGMLSMLYSIKRGPVIAGSVSEYKRTETNNMQVPCDNIRHFPLIPHLRIEANGRIFSTAFCFESKIKGEKTDNGFIVTAVTRPETVYHEPFSEITESTFVYKFTKEQVNISVSGINLPKDAKLIIPVISSAGVRVIGKYENKEKVFFLTGGFGADEYVFSSENFSFTIM